FIRLVSRTVTLLNHRSIVKRLYDNRHDCRVAAQVAVSGIPLEARCAMPVGIRDKSQHAGFLLAQLVPNQYLRVVVVQNAIARQGTDDVGQRLAVRLGRRQCGICKLDHLIFIADQFQTGHSWRPVDRQLEGLGIRWRDAVIRLNGEAVAALLHIHWRTTENAGSAEGNAVRKTAGYHAERRRGHAVCRYREAVALSFIELCRGGTGDFRRPFHVERKGTPCRPGTVGRGNYRTVDTHGARRRRAADRIGAAVPGNAGRQAAGQAQCWFGYTGRGKLDCRAGDALSITCRGATTGKYGREGGACRCDIDGVHVDVGNVVIGSVSVWDLQAYRDPVDRGEIRRRTETHRVYRAIEVEHHRLAIRHRTDAGVVGAVHAGCIASLDRHAQRILALCRQCTLDSVH